MLANIGHNNPPSETEILCERLNSYTEVFKELERLSAREIPDEVNDDKSSGAIADHIKSLKMLNKGVEEIHKREKAPFLEAGRAADAWKNNFTAEIDALVKMATKPVLAWNKKKEEAERQRQLEIARKAREEAEKLAAEAEAHAKEGIEDTAEDLMNAALEEEFKAEMIQDNAFHGVKGRTIGGFSSATNKQTWTGVLDSRAALDLDALRNYFKEDDLNKAIKAAVKDGVRELRGARIYQEDKLNIR